MLIYSTEVSFSVMPEYIGVFFPSCLKLNILSCWNLMSLATYVMHLCLVHELHMFQFIVSIQKCGHNSCVRRVWDVLCHMILKS